METSNNTNQKNQTSPSAIPKAEEVDEDALLHLIKEESKHKKYWLGFSLAIFALILGWSGLVLGFGRYQIGYRKLSLFSSSSSIRNTLTEQAEAYKLTVSYPDHTTKTFNLADMGMNINLDASVKAIQHIHASEIVMWWQPKQTDLKIDIDQLKFHDFLQKSISVTTQPAKDATISIKKGKVIISNSTAGKRFGLVFPQDTLTEGANSLKNSTVELQLLAYKPTITSKQLQPYETQLKKILGQRVVLSVAGNSHVLSSRDIGSWLDLSFDKNNKFKIDVNSGKIAASIDQIAQPYVTEPRDEVQVKRDDGSVTVIATGVKGIDVYHKSQIAVDISKNLLSGEGIDEELPIKTANFKTVTAGDFPKWIEVNLTEKRMYVYERTSLIKTFNVSAGAPATPTVLGEYKIQRKYVQQDMFGQNADGTDYFQPKVPWVLYFYGGYAIHGNYWRPLTWFGNINSSHGCVGVSVADGKWIYDWAPVGTPIINHM